MRDVIKFEKVLKEYGFAVFCWGLGFIVALVTGLSFLLSIILIENGIAQDVVQVVSSSNESSIFHIIFYLAVMILIVVGDTLRRMTQKQLVKMYKED